MKQGYKAVMQFKHIVAVSMRNANMFGTACDAFPFEPRYCVMKSSDWVSGSYSIKTKRATPIFTVEFERKDFNMDKKGDNTGKLGNGWQAAFEFFKANPRVKKCYVLDNAAFLCDVAGVDSVEELCY